MTCPVAVTLAPPATWANVVGEVGVADQPEGTVTDRATFVTVLAPPLVNVALAVAGWPATATGGVESVRVACTSMTAVPGTPFTFTVIVATPSLMARTSP